MTIIDLHLHSIFSDGTDSPAEILPKLKACGIKYFSLTDHDTDKGCSEIAELIQNEPDLYFTYGVEFSCKYDDENKYNVKKKKATKKNVINSVIEEKLSTYFGMKVKIDSSKARPRLIIEYFNDDGLANILDKLNIEL